MTHHFLVDEETVHGFAFFFQKLGIAFVVITRNSCDRKRGKGRKSVKQRCYFLYFMILR